MPITEEELARYTLIGLEQERQKLEDTIAELKSRGHQPVVSNQPAATKPANGSSTVRKVMSPEARERIAAAQRARWAAQKQGKGRAKGQPAASSQSKPIKKRKISAEARARMAEAQRKRWAATRKAVA